MDPKPILLAGRLVRLEPLTPAHAPSLLAAVQADPSIWRWLTMPPPETLAEMEALIADDLALQARGELVPFAQVEQATGRPAGHTTYMNISRRDRGLEIGGTWLGRAWHRTGINTEAKYLLLRHAFEELGAVRVQLKTDARNVQSQAAIARLGAVREGLLRKHMLSQHGFLRDTAMFSVIDTEWPAVKARLEGLLAAHTRPGEG
jgi:RimJ/RimL family protein N-acetyltransferase